MAVRLESVVDGVVVFSQEFPTHEDAEQYCKENNLTRPTFKIGSN